MKHSAPNTWRYGGVITEAAWESSEMMLRVWGGHQERVRPGDTILVFWSGQGAQVADVVPRDPEEAIEA